jgi:hypothetical protein
MPYLEKMPSFELNGFIESLVQKYKLEDYTQDPDPEIRDLLLQEDSLEDIAALKLLHDDEENFYPYSAKLWYILRDIINSRLDFSKLENTISQQLSLPGDTSQAIATEIQNNELVKNELNAPAELDEDFSIADINTSTEFKQKGIGQELM